MPANGRPALGPSGRGEVTDARDVARVVVTAAERLTGRTAPLTTPAAGGLRTDRRVDSSEAVGEPAATFRRLRGDDRDELDRFQVNGGLEATEPAAGHTGRATAEPTDRAIADPRDRGRERPFHQERNQT